MNTSSAATAGTKEADARPTGVRLAVRTSERAARWFPFERLEPILMRHLRTEGKGLSGWCEEKQLPLRAIQRARKRGRISWILADEIACAMGLHPAVIWNEWCM